MSIKLGTVPNHGGKRVCKELHRPKVSPIRPHKSQEKILPQRGTVKKKITKKGQPKKIRSY